MAGALAGHYAGALADAGFRAELGFAGGNRRYATPRRGDDGIRSKELQLAFDSPAVGKQRQGGGDRETSGHARTPSAGSQLSAGGGDPQADARFAGHAAAFRASDGRAAGLGSGGSDVARELGEPQRKEIERVLGSKLGKFIRATYNVDAG